MTWTAAGCLLIKIMSIKIHDGYPEKLKLYLALQLAETIQFCDNPGNVYHHTARVM